MALHQDDVVLCRPQFTRMKSEAKAVAWVSELLGGAEDLGKIKAELIVPVRLTALVLLAS